MDDFKEQLEKIREQSKEDFKFVMIALDNVTHELGTVKAKMARQEERFESMLDIVQNALADNVKRAEFEDVRARVEALERKSA